LARASIYTAGYNCPRTAQCM